MGQQTRHPVWYHFYEPKKDTRSKCLWVRLIGFTKDERTEWAQKTPPPQCTGGIRRPQLLPRCWEGRRANSFPTDKGYDEFGGLYRGPIMTNTVQYSLHGTHQHLSPSHLSRYCPKLYDRVNRKIALQTMVHQVTYGAMRTPSRRVQLFNYSSELKLVVHHKNKATAHHQLSGIFHGFSDY